jgi:hypothetical protein
LDDRNHVAQCPFSRSADASAPDPGKQEKCQAPNPGAKTE